jgi:carbamate kinase
MKRTAVIALGGNALLRSDDSGSIEDQTINTYQTCKCVATLLKKFDSIIITHGNGPQVGNILLRNEAGFRNFNIPKMPLDICVADSQGGIGYLIERQMKNVLQEEGIDKEVVTLITEVLVDANDPAFQKPTKPVGAYYTEDEAKKLAEANNWQFKADSRGRGWRRVVASPKPVEILNRKVVSDLSSMGYIVIVSGGGGVPVVRDEKGSLHGIDAVIDKDSAASLLATEIKAQELFILTDIQKVAINFKKPDQQFLDKITVDEAKAFFERGEFEAGSMGPKVQAGINFVSKGGERTIITDASALTDIENGTQIVK